MKASIILASALAMAVRGTSVNAKAPAAAPAQDFYGQIINGEYIVLKQDDNAHVLGFIKCAGVQELTKTASKLEKVIVDPKTNKPNKEYITNFAKAPPEVQLAISVVFLELLVVSPINAFQASPQTFEQDVLTASEQSKVKGKKCPFGANASEVVYFNEKDWAVVPPLNGGIHANMLESIANAITGPAEAKKN